MPIVPQVAQPISLDVPGTSADTGNAGIIGRAVSGLGGRVADLAFDAANKLRTIEAHDAVYQATNDDLIRSQEKIAELTTKYPDGYLRDDVGNYILEGEGVNRTRRTISQEYRDWANDRFQKNQESMPSQMAQELYKEQQGKFFTSGIATMYNDQLIGRAEATKKSLGDVTQRYSNTLLATPSRDNRDFYISMDSLYDRIHNGVANGEFSPLVADQLKREMGSTLAESNIRGYLLYIQDQSVANKGTGVFNSREEAKKVLRILDGKDMRSISRRNNELPTLASALSPDQQARLRSQAIQVLATTEKLDMSAYHNFINGMNNRALLRKIDAKSGVAKIIQESQPFLNNGQIAVPELADDIGKFIASIGVGKTDTREFSRLPESMQWAEEKRILGEVEVMSKQFVPEESPLSAGVGYAAQQYAHEKLKDLIVTQSKKNYNDSFATAVEYDPQTLGRLQTLVNWDDPSKWHAPEFYKFIDMGEAAVRAKNPQYGAQRRVISKEMGQRMGDALMSPNVQDSVKSDALIKLATYKPETYYKIMGQLVRDRSLGYEWEFVTRLPTQRLATEFVSTLSHLSSEQEKSFDLYLKNNNMTRRNFSDQLQFDMPKFVAAVQQSMPWDNRQLEMANVLNNFFERKVMMNLLQPGAGSIAEESNRAYQALVGNTQHIFQLKRGGILSDASKSVSMVRLPKTLSDGTPVTADDQDKIQSWQEDNFTVEGFKHMGIARPANFPKDIAPDRMYEQFVHSAYLVSDPTNPERFNIWFHGENDMTPVQLLRDTKGYPPITIPVKDILVDRAAKERRSTTGMKKFWKAIIDSQDKGAFD